jgi:hypothetical protein
VIKINKKEAAVKFFRGNFVVLLVQRQPDSEENGFLPVHNPRLLACRPTSRSLCLQKEENQRARAEDVFIS